MTNKLKNISQLEVLILVGTHCNYCGPMLKILSEMVKQGEFARLQVVNIEKDDTLAKELGVRSVPWVRIGPFELSGMRTKDEINQWLKRATSDNGITIYLEEILAEGNVGTAIDFVKRFPESVGNVIDLMLDTNGKINVRLGVGVIIEDIAESKIFKQVIPRLIDALSDDDARVRGDACHYLSLTNDVKYLPVIEPLLSDDSDEVKEIALDSINELKALES